MSLKRAYDGGSNYPIRAFKSRRTNYGRTPMMTSMFNSSFGRSAGISKPRSFYSGRRKGPYRVLTSGQRHSNPIYPKPECKIYDADHAGVSPPATAAQAITNTGTVVCLNQMVTGTGVQQFTGNQVSIKQCSYRYELDLPATGAVPTSGRVLLIWDKQPNGTVAAFTDIFQQASYLAFGNVNSRERFVILRNDQFSLSPQGDQTLFFEQFVNINMLTTFVNGQSTAGVPLTGALLLAYIGDQSTAGTRPTIAGWFRVRYYDN